MVHLDPEWTLFLSVELFLDLVNYSVISQWGRLAEAALVMYNELSSI